MNNNIYIKFANACYQNCTQQIKSFFKKNPEKHIDEINSLLLELKIIFNSCKSYDLNLYQNIQKFFTEEFLNLNQKHLIFNI